MTKTATEAIESIQRMILSRTGPNEGEDPSPEFTDKANAIIKEIEELDEIQAAR